MSRETNEMLFAGDNGAACVPSPLRGVLGRGALDSAPEFPRPPIQPSPARGEGFPRGTLVAILSLWSVLMAPVSAHAEVVVGTRSISHGVKVWYTQNDTVPVVDVVMSFEGAGSASDPEGKGGRAAFAAALITEGADDMDSVAFRRALEENAITMTAETDEDRLRIHVYCLREHAARAGELLARALAKPLLAEADQARMKADISSMLARLDEQPSYHAQRALLQRAFKGHPYANVPYGDAASLASLGADDVRDYLKTYVTRGNVLIAASGDVDAGLLDAMLEPVVEGLADNDSGAVAATQAAVQGGGEMLRKTLAAPQTTILFAAPAVARDDPRFYAAYLLNHILGGSGLTSRLSDVVRQQKGLAYSVDSDLDIKRGAVLLTGALATRNATTDEAIAAVKSVLEELHGKGVTTEECADAKNYVLGAFARQLDSNASVSNLLLSMQIHKLGEDYVDERAALFSKVSCADINTVAEELLSPPRFVFSVVGGAVDAAPGAAPASGDTK